MLVNPVSQNLRNVSFGAKKDDTISKEKLSKDINKALHVLGDKKLELIIHNASAPSEDGKDIGIGSMYSNSTRNMLLPFLKTYGFSALQLDPEGMRPEHDPSPYVTNSFVYNPLIIDLENLTKPENGSLLNQNLYQSIVDDNVAKNNEKGDYKYARDSVNKAIDNAYSNMILKAQNPDLVQDPQELDGVFAMAEALEQHMQENKQILEPYAIYSVLTEKFGNDYYKNWPSEYANLYADDNQHLINQIKYENADMIEKFFFTDMLATKARNEGVRAFQQEGIKTQGDNPVAFSNQEVWAHPKAFLNDYKMGCPPEHGNPEGQAWGFPVLNPAKLFNRDGSYGEAGQLLYDKCAKLARDNQGGIRIDHIVGLIDPFVYKNSPAENTAGRLFSSENNHELRQYAIPRNRHDSDRRFGAILEDIVIPACENEGVNKNDIMCENLGSIPDHANRAFNRLGLGGMVVLQYHNSKDAKKMDTIMPGSHDTLPLNTYVNNIYGKDEFNHKLWQATENSMHPSATGDQKQAEFDKYRFDTNPHTPERNKQGLVQKKFTELFTSPAQRAQIFWTDLLGMEQRYNTPGTSEGNWTLRMTSDFEQNFNPEILIQSLSDAIKAQDSQVVRENQDLINSLDSSAQKLRDSGGNLDILV